MILPLPCGPCVERRRSGGARMSHADRRFLSGSPAHGPTTELLERVIAAIPDGPIYQTQIRNNGLFIFGSHDQTTGASGSPGFFRARGPREECSVATDAQRRRSRRDGCGLAYRHSSESLSGTVRAAPR